MTNLVDLQISAIRKWLSFRVTALKAAPNRLTEFSIEPESNNVFLVDFFTYGSSVHMRVTDDEVELLEDWDPRIEVFEYRINEWVMINLDSGAFWRSLLGFTGDPKLD